ncbi:hypothetical protein N7447_004936 [Penicillium robsamsonii]|uniref:uncharacterized protein n=1 Tax=Penicillium robsamsonii TaxID=1792511 RepID=UPI002549340F|nr:uncharacterized protein N7447_004936 [Penicillium robsamsonii]KAJ5822596.1 hypothetical protein N7447_004936 [Penicillium robsamsonii]
MPFADPAHSRILGDTINALENVERKSHEPNGGNAPVVFRETAKHIPSLLVYFEKCKQHLDATIMAEEFHRLTIGYLKTCERNASRVNEIFTGVVGSSNSAEQYRRVAQGDQLEDLMKKILENAIAMSSTTQLTAISGTEVHGLNQSLCEFQAMPASLPEVKPSYSFTNFGSGNQNLNTGTGHQYNNNGSGNMFTGAIQSFSMSR